MLNEHGLHVEHERADTKASPNWKIDQLISLSCLVLIVLLLISNTDSSKLIWL